MHKCCSPLVQEHISSPHLRLHFPLLLYMGIQSLSALCFLYLLGIYQIILAIKLFKTNDGCSSAFDLQKRLIITSPSSSSMFLFLLEQFPSGPCVCASGDHEVRTVTDITVSFHCFLTGDLLSSTDWANNSTRILILLWEHGWGDSKCRTIVFSQQHLIRERWCVASPCPLEWQGPLPNLLDTLPESRVNPQNPEDLKISFLWRACLLVGKKLYLPELLPCPLKRLCEGPCYSVVTSSSPDPCPQVSIVSAALRH